MRQILILTILLSGNSLLFAQKIPKFLQDRIDFCNSNLSEEQTTQLRTEVEALEDYFLKEGLLADKSGGSYRAVYERIAKENDVKFEIDADFKLLSTLEFQVYTGCFYKLLNPEQISELTLRHQEATERIAKGYKKGATPGLVAQGIIDNLTIQDFELEFYRISSLLTFYRIAYPKSSLDLGLPNFCKNTNTDIETIEIVLNESSQIEIEEAILNLKEAENKIYLFLKTDPEKKGIELTASRSAAYASYSDVIDMLNSVYLTLTEELEKSISKNIIFNEPK